MIRLIVQMTDTAAACNVGGPVVVTYRTFDVNLPELESLIRDNTWEPGKKPIYGSAAVIGAEVLAPSPPEGQ